MPTDPPDWRQRLCAACVGVCPEDWSEQQVRRVIHDYVNRLNWHQSHYRHIRTEQALPLCGANQASRHTIYREHIPHHYFAITWKRFVVSFTSIDVANNSRYLLRVQLSSYATRTEFIFASILPVSLPSIFEFIVTMVASQAKNLMNWTE